MHMTPRNSGMSKRVVFVFGRPVVVSVPLRPSVIPRSRHVAGVRQSQPAQNKVPVKESLTVNVDGTASISPAAMDKNPTYIVALLAFFFCIGLLLIQVAVTTPSLQTPKVPEQARMADETWDQHVRRLVKTNLDGVNVAEIKDRQVQCLAKNIYFESRGQPLAGQVGVAKVTLNRLEQGWAQTVCGVVYQKIVDGVCQFSWVCNDERRSPSGYDWRLAVGIALTLLNDGDHVTDPTGGATHFHATYIQPAWRTLMTGANQIGDHIFYRVKSKSQ